ncbi:hypothetical protein [Nocardia africana]
MSNDSKDPELRSAAKYCMETVLAYAKWRETHGVEPGSKVAGDDKAFSVMSMTELLSGQLAAAVDCLLLATWTLNETGHARGHGHPAIIRSAITPATCALWIMDDDESERRIRALKIAYTQAEAESLHVRDIAPSWRHPDAKGIGAFMESRERRKQGIIEDGARLGFTEKEIKHKPKDQDIVRGGASRLPVGWLGDNPGASVISEWRLLSGRAHGFQWSIKYSSEPVGDGDREGFATYDLGWSLDRALGSVRVALRVLRFGLDRWAELAGLPRVSLQTP